MVKLSVEKVQKIQNELARKHVIGIKTRGELTGPKNYSFYQPEKGIINPLSEEVLAEIWSKQYHITELHYKIGGVEQELLNCLFALSSSIGNSKERIRKSVDRDELGNHLLESIGSKNASKSGNKSVFFHFTSSIFIDF